jgi:hypothetical protein
MHAIGKSVNLTLSTAGDSDSQTILAEKTWGQRKALCSYDRR